MAVKKAHAEWRGDFRTGKGEIKPGSGTFSAEYTLDSIRTGEGGSSPTELLCAALTSCFNGMLAAVLSEKGHVPTRICTDSELELCSQTHKVTRIDMKTSVEVSGIDEKTLCEIAEFAKKSCPVSMALGDVEVTLETRLSGR